MKRFDLRKINSGRRHQPRYRASVLIIIFMTTLFVVASLYVQDLIGKIKIALASEQLVQSERQFRMSAEEENRLLKEKLERSTKIETPQVTKEVVRFYLNKYFGQDAEKAEKVFTCESGLNPHATNTNTGIHTGSVDRGVAQINDKFHKARFEEMFGVPFEIGAHDVYLNLQYAKHLWERQGWTPWVCRFVLK